MKISLESADTSVILLDCQHYNKTTRCVSKLSDFVFLTRKSDPATNNKGN